MDGLDGYDTEGDVGTEHANGDYEGYEGREGAHGRKRGGGRGVGVEGAGRVKWVLNVSEKRDAGPIFDGLDYISRDSRRVLRFLMGSLVGGKGAEGVGRWETLF